MGSEENILKPEPKEQILQIFRDFMTRVTKLEELSEVGGRLLIGFQQALELLRRPPLNKESTLIQNILKANETERLKSYVEAGCVKNHDRVENMSKLQTCLLGLHAHLAEAKSVLNELGGLLEDLASAIETVDAFFLPVRNEDSGGQFEQQRTTDQEEESLSVSKELEISDFASVVAIIYSMVKREYIMQEKIITSLNLKSSSEELESYCLMWTLRPFVNDEIMHQAWKLI